MRVVGVAVLLLAYAALSGCQTGHGDLDEPSASEMRAFDDGDSAQLALKKTDLEAGQKAGDAAEGGAAAGADAAAAGGEASPSGASGGGDKLTEASPGSDLNDPLAGAGPAMAGPTAGQGELKAEAVIAPADDGKHYGLGPLAEDDLRKLVYQNLEQRVAKTQSVGAGEEEATELGDLESFKFTIVKLVRGADDISGSPSDAPDGMDVEVTGWYKRTASVKGGGPPPACTSFDATVSIVQTAGEWRARSAQPAFGREDSEDCY